MDRQLPREVLPILAGVMWALCEIVLHQLCGHPALAAGECRPGLLCLLTLLKILLALFSVCVLPLDQFIELLLYDFCARVLF